MFAGVAAVALSACANNRTSMAQADFGGASATQQATALSQLAGRYKANPRDKATIIYYAAALRAAGQPEQATSVMENGVALYKSDSDIKVAYAKALSATGRFDQALNVVDDAINPAQPDANYRLGNYFMKEANAKAAIRHYQAALKASPDDPKLIYSLKKAEKYLTDGGTTDVTF